MEGHTRLLEALCRIFWEKTKGKERKDVAKYADEIKLIWEVSVLVVIHRMCTPVLSLESQQPVENHLQHRSGSEADRLGVLQ